jgi:hypothetical protein
MQLTSRSGVTSFQSDSGLSTYRLLQGGSWRFRYTTNSIDAVTLKGFGRSIHRGCPVFSEGLAVLRPSVFCEGFFGKR